MSWLSQISIAITEKLASSALWIQNLDHDLLLQSNPHPEAGSMLSILLSPCSSGEAADSATVYTQTGDCISPGS